MPPEAVERVAAEAAAAAAEQAGAAADGRSGAATDEADEPIDEPQTEDDVAKLVQVAIAQAGGIEPLVALALDGTDAQVCISPDLPELARARLSSLDLA